MNVGAIKECSICLGKGYLRAAFGFDINKPKCVWIECDCGIRTPMCDDTNTAIKIWNWMHRETPGEMHKIKQKKIQQDKIEKENLKIECQNKERIAKIDKINKAYAKNKKDDVIFTPKRRGRPRKLTYSNH